MNINMLANRMTRAVNKNAICDIYKSAGMTVGYGGQPTPLFTKVTEKNCQVQPVSSDTLAMIDSLNIQGNMREIYVDYALTDPETQPEISQVERSQHKGGDVIFYNSRWWKVVKMIEKWDTASWCHALIVEQVPKDIKALGLGA